MSKNGIGDEGGARGAELIRWATGLVIENIWYGYTIQRA